MDYYKFFKLIVKMHIDLDLLKNIWIKERVNMVSDNDIIMLNAAYNTLKNPATRIDYILKIHNIEPLEFIAMNHDRYQSILIENFEIRESFKNLILSNQISEKEKNIQQNIARENQMKIYLNFYNKLENTMFSLEESIDKLLKETEIPNIEISLLCLEFRMLLSAMDDVKKYITNVS